MIEESPVGNKLNGFYRGIVLKHLSNGFCKIFIPSVYPEEWNNYENADKLPSAEQASPISFGCNNGLGVFSYPNIGSVVWCFFANGDQNLPVYFASTLGGDKAVSPGNWDNARAMAGSHPDDAYVHKIHVKNSDIEIYETGMVKVHTENSGETASVNIDSQGNITLECSNQLSIKAKNIAFTSENSTNIETTNLTMSGKKIVSIEGEGIGIDAQSGLCKITSPENSLTI